MRTTLMILLLPLTAAGQFGYNSVDTYAGNGTSSLTDGSLAASSFDWPYGICYDLFSDAFYVADMNNNCIRKMQGGTVTTVAGNGTVGDVDAQGANARFDHPTGVFYKNGYLYIADNWNNKIKRMDALGNVETIAGSGTLGFADGPAASAKFREPKSIVVDDSGVVFIADYENHRLRKLKNGTVSTIAGTGVAGDGLGPALSAQLHRPRDLCLDPAGNLYFVDLENDRVKVLTTSGTVDLVAGSGVPGFADGTGSAAQFNRPVGIDWIATDVLVVLDAVDPRVRRVTVGGVVNTIAGSGSTGYFDGACADAEFSLPQDVCVDMIGNIYVGDRNNNVIRIISHGLPQAVADPGESVVHELVVFPNPATDLISVDLSGVGEAIAGVRVNDAVGRTVLEKGPDGMERSDLLLNLSIAGLAPGRYDVIVMTASRSYRTSFFR